MPRTRKTTTPPAPGRDRQRPAAVQRLARDLMEQLMFGTGRVRRFTQDTPVLPDVWLEYAGAPGDGAADDTGDPRPPVKLLLTPFREAAAGDVSRLLRQRLATERATASWRAFGHAPDRPPRVIYNQSIAAATLYFEDLVRVVLPMTDWWGRIVRTWDPAEIQRPEAQRTLAVAVKNPEHPPIDRGERRAAAGHAVDAPRGGRGGPRASGASAAGGLHRSPPRRRRRPPSGTGCRWYGRWRR